MGQTDAKSVKVKKAIDEIQALSSEEEELVSQSASPQASPSAISSPFPAIQEILDDLPLVQLPNLQGLEGVWKVKKWLTRHPVSIFI